MVKSNVNCSIEAEVKEGAKRLNLEFSRALEFGLKFRAAEINDTEYPSNLLSHKLESMAERLGEAHRRIEELEEAPAAGEKIYGTSPVETMEKELRYPGAFYGN